MSSETNTPSNTMPPSTVTQEQLQEASGVYRSAVFNFYEGYTNAYNAAIQAGVDAQQAAINGLEAAQRAASQAFMDAYTAANTMGSGSVFGSAYAEAAETSFARADALLNDTRAAQTILAEYTQQATSDFTNIIGDNPLLKAVGQNGGMVGDAIEVGVAWWQGDSGDVAKALVGVALGTVGALLGSVVATALVSVVTVPAIVAGGIIAAFGVLGGYSTNAGTDAFWDSIADSVLTGVHNISDAIADLFTSATQAIQPIRRDPLVLDLDNDGLETTGINATNPIRFDHDADGIKTATGWVNTDDAFSVRQKRQRRHRQRPRTIWRCDVEK